jgi:hypothetical protein
MTCHWNGVGVADKIPKSVEANDGQITDHGKSEFAYLELVYKLLANHLTTQPVPG